METACLDFWVETLTFKRRVKIFLEHYRSSRFIARVEKRRWDLWIRWRKIWTEAFRNMFLVSDKHPQFLLGLLERNQTLGSVELSKKRSKQIILRKIEPSVFQHAMSHFKQVIKEIRSNFFECQKHWRETRGSQKRRLLSCTCPSKVLWVFYYVPVFR